MFKKLAVLAVAGILFAAGAEGAVTHGGNMQGGLAEAVLDSCGTTAIVVLMTGADAVLDTVALANPPFTRTGATLNLAGGTQSGVASANGTITKWKIVNGGGSTIVQGLVSDGITIDNPAVVIGQTVNITAFSYTAAP